MSYEIIKRIRYIQGRGNWGQYPIKILRGNNLVQCLKDYTIFNSAEDAEIWGHVFQIR